MSRNFLLVLLTIWLLTLVLGGFSLARYESTPGEAAAPAARWPADSLVPRVSHSATLVMFAHPRCPCTRASLAELARLMAQCPGQVNAIVLFFAPQNAAQEWTKTVLWNSAATIPGVTPRRDEEGREAERFHARTSGETLLYDAAGKLLFQGGITDGRGHEGDNDGRASLVALLTSGHAWRTCTPVFGCALKAPLFAAPLLSQERGIQCKK
jgi:hypothetical protein